LNLHQPLAEHVKFTMSFPERCATVRILKTEELNGVAETVLDTGDFFDGGRAIPGIFAERQ
jgi:hypothetical protein